MNANHATIDFRTQDEHQQRDDAPLEFVVDEMKAAEIRLHVPGWRERNGLEPFPARSLK